MKHGDKADSQWHTPRNDPATVVGCPARAVDCPPDQRIGERVDETGAKQHEPDQRERKPRLASVKRRQQHEEWQFEQSKRRAQKPVRKERAHRELGRMPASGGAGALRKQGGAGHGRLSARVR